ncbi:MAG: hypothetical protein Q9227_007639 [Pyrenula ochraceoflavens]
MLDPVPPPPTRFTSLIQPLASNLNLHTLPLHIHEVVFAAALYQFVGAVVSPRVSSYLFPNYYPKLSRRTQISWDVHVVSFVQANIVNVLALWLIFFDEERANMNATERVYGYTGASGLVQAFGVGYFLWDLIISTIYFPIFGIGSWAHAMAALWVFVLGFRPFINFYGPTFLLYELSSPFLNIHWFCDKIDMTGSSLQWYNGMALIGSFFSARLLWGTYQSVHVFRDIWAAVNIPQIPSSGSASVANMTVNAAAEIFVPRNGELCLGKLSCLKAQGEVMRFADATRAGSSVGPIPLWLAATYLGSNIVLNSLNVHWFGKMIATVKKRFAEPVEKKEGEKADSTIKDENKSTAVDGGIVKEGAEPARRGKRADSVVLAVADGLEEDDFIGHPTSAVEVGESKGEMRRRN